MFYLLSDLGIVSLFIFRRSAVFVIISQCWFLLVFTFCISLIINYSLPVAHRRFLGCPLLCHVCSGLLPLLQLFPCLILLDF